MDLEGGILRCIGCVAEDAEAEPEAEPETGLETGKGPDPEDWRGGGGWKWGPRQDIDADGENLHLITKGTEPSGPLAYALGLEIHHPTMSTIWGHGGRLYIQRERLLRIKMIMSMIPYMKTSISKTMGILKSSLEYNWNVAQVVQSI